MLNPADKAAILHETLPYIQRFHGRIFVIKYGGSAMVDPHLRESFARDINVMKFVGLHPVVVHGGGPQIDAILAELGVVSERIDGLRVTDDPTMEVVEMVLGGKLNQEIVSLIGRYGTRAVGLNGKDDRFLLGEKVARMKTKAGHEVDPGRVGNVISVKTKLLRGLIESGFVPVIAPIAIDDQGNSLNVNADTVAGAVAAALEAEKLLLMTDTAGVHGRDGKPASSLSAKEISELITDGVIDGGMIPKVRCGLDALADGVRTVHILDGRVRHAAVLEIFTDEGIGTQITG